VEYKKKNQEENEKNSWGAEGREFSNTLRGKIYLRNSSTKEKERQGQEEVS